MLEKLSRVSPYTEFLPNLGSKEKSGKYVLLKKYQGIRLVLETI